MPKMSIGIQDGDIGIDPIEIGKTAEFDVYSERGRNRKHPA